MLLIIVMILLKNIDARFLDFYKNVSLAPAAVFYIEISAEAAYDSLSEDLKDIICIYLENKIWGIGLMRNHYSCKVEIWVGFPNAPPLI